MIVVCLCVIYIHVFVGVVCGLLRGVVWFVFVCVVFVCVCPWFRHVLRLRLIV